MRIILLVCCFSIVLYGCASTKILQATGGSRADAIVELSYSYGAFEEPQVDWDSGLRTATDRCRAWDYSSADPFGGTMSDCQSYDGYGNCMSWIVTAKYQCIGSLSS